MYADVLLVLALSALRPAETEGNPPQELAADTLRDAVVFFANGPSRRTLVGDWEPPTVVALAFTSAWEKSLAELIDLGAEAAALRIANAEPENPEGFQRFLKSLNVPSARLAVDFSHLDTPWMRDYGALAVREDNGRIIWLDADYSSTRPQDDQWVAHVASVYHTRVETLRARLDGGAVVSNGRGLCMSTWEAFEDNHLPTRPGQRMQRLLKRLGCRALVLTSALIDDDTKHADLFAQFLNPGLVVVAEFEPDVAPEDAESMENAARALAHAAHMLGQPLRVVRLRTAVHEAVYYTHINGVNLGSVYLVPRYTGPGARFQASAYATLAALLPRTQLWPVDTDAMIELGGALHCITTGLHLDSTAPRETRALTQRRRAAGNPKNRRRL